MRFPRATRLVIHCQSQEEALAVRRAVEARLWRCRLEAHLEKTRVVYCPDSNSTLDQRHIPTGFGSENLPAHPDLVQECHG